MNTYQFAYVQCNTETDFVSSKICRGGLYSKKWGNTGSIYGWYIIKLDMLH